MAVLRIKDEQGNWHSIKTIKGEKGNSYVLTEQDKEQIADIAKELLETEINEMHEEISQLDRDVVNADNELTALAEELQEQEQNINHLDDIKIDNTVDNLLNYYLKEETYTKREILDLIGNIEKVHLRKVNQLPQIGEENIIYLVNGSEYIWAENSYELLGTTEIDLSDYYTRDEIDDTNKNFVTTGFLIGTLNNYEPKIPNTTDLMFQSVLYGNGESGFRKWRNGFIEQWGVATSSASGESEFTMHQAHIDTNFSIIIEPREKGNFFHYAMPSMNQKFKTRIQSKDGISMAIKFQWKSWGRWK